MGKGVRRRKGGGESEKWREGVEGERNGEGEGDIVM